MTRLLPADPRTPQINGRAHAMMAAIGGSDICDALAAHCIAVACLVHSLAKATGSELWGGLAEVETFIEERAAWFRKARGG